VSADVLHEIFLAIMIASVLTASLWSTRRASSARLFQARRIATYAVAAGLCATVTSFWAGSWWLTLIDAGSVYLCHRTVRSLAGWARRRYVDEQVERIFADWVDRHRRTPDGDR
jgi:hypothetical protein